MTLHETVAVERFIDFFMYLLLFFFLFSLSGTAAAQLNWLETYIGTKKTKKKHKQTHKMVDYYKILEINKSSTEPEIKKA